MKQLVFLLSLCVHNVVPCYCIVIGRALEIVQVVVSSNSVSLSEVFIVAYQTPCF